MAQCGSILKRNTRSLNFTSEESLLFNLQHEASRMCKFLSVACVVADMNIFWCGRQGFSHRQHMLSCPPRVAAYEGGLRIETCNRLCEEGQLFEAVEALDLLVEQGYSADNFVFYELLKKCVGEKDFVLGRRVHALAVKGGYEADAFLANHIIRMYSSNGRLDDATQVFKKVAEPDCHMWAAIILAHARHGQPQKAIEFYRQMKESGVKANNHVFVGVLKACANAEDLSSGKDVHADILGTADKPNIYVDNCLVDMYSRCGSLEDARRVFQNLPRKNVVTWNAMMTGYVQNGLGQEALTLYANMQEEGTTPVNHVTYVLLLQACATVGALQQGKQLHAHIQDKGLQANVAVGTCLVDMYAKCGSIVDARNVFDKLPIKNVVTWTAMITGYSHLGLGKEALSLYAIMQQEGITSANHVTFVCLLQACASVGALNQGKQLHAQIHEQGLETDEVIGNCLVDMYAKCGSLKDARRVFDNLSKKTVVTWTAMIAGYALQGFGHEALALYESMQQDGLTPANHVTFACLLQACRSVSHLEKGKEIHAQISNLGLQNTDSVLASNLIDMYGNCGSMVDAQEVFEALPRKEICTWNVLIAGYARQGNSELVFELFHRMSQEDIEPDGITFLSVLAVCNHAGLVDKSHEYFEAMYKYHGISPSIEHYNCMVDVLGRAGQVEKAMEMVKAMPFQPHLEVWRSLLGACQKWRNVELGKQAFECVMRLDRTDGAAYMLMSNIYAAANMQDKAKEIQAMRLTARVRKKPGQSWWTDVDGMMHRFEVGDRQQPGRQRRYANLGDVVKSHSN